jgi:GGDEF domain-containing protein
MVRPSQHRVLLVGDQRGLVQTTLAEALPGAHVRIAPTVFDGIAELAQERYSAVLVAAEPVGRRPVAAVRALRELAGPGRLILFGDAGTEPLSMRMLQFGCDDYLITPVQANQLERILAGKADSPLRLHSEALPSATDYDDPRLTPAPPPAPVPEPAEALISLSVGEIVTEALLDHPGDAIGFAIKQLNARLPVGMRLAFIAPASPAPAANRPGQISIALKVPANAPAGWLTLNFSSVQGLAAESALGQIATLLGRTLALQTRYNRLGKLAFTDDLTGSYNCRYFKHFLNTKLAEARKGRFPVTLFLFDIDNFKSYNDRFGHGVGDEILKQVSSLMRRCVRDHDLVARIGGDEFAVIFWEKDAPRQPRESGIGTPGRPPSEPEQILARFQRLLESETYPKLGSSGQGTLTISGGLAVYPYDAADVDSLMKAADDALMFGAKRSGRNSIQIVSGETPAKPA